MWSGNLISQVILEYWRKCKVVLLEPVPTLFHLSYYDWLVALNWNKLPHEIIESENIWTFKSKLEIIIDLFIYYLDNYELVL